jgi:hypothetical protein
MRGLLLGAALLALVPAVGSAQTFRTVRPMSPAPTSRTTTDFETGNTYTTRTKPDGGADVQGSNFNTGSTWNTKVKPNGDQSGTDANGNMWQYNARSGSYMNTDGTTCIGKGQLRTCN